tara:strand:+ start:61 stop:267 length:207 start_codon:yes stop_codon:yes gene_type:complete
MLFLKNLKTTILARLKEFFNCHTISNKYFGRKTPPIPPRQKATLPAMERRLAGARNIVVKGSLDKNDE